MYYPAWHVAFLILLRDFRSYIPSINIQLLKMCRMCSYYLKIDVKHLSTSNPFSEEYSTPAEAAMPSNIIVESPESRKHTAWSNLRRFPSLDCPAAPASTVSRKAFPGHITIRGPRELAKQPNLSCNEPDLPPQQPAIVRNPSRPSSSTSSRLSPRKLQHQGRTDSLQSIYALDCDHSSDTSTLKSMSPVSEDEFSYLSLSHERPIQGRHKPVIRDGSRVFNVAEVPLSAPLRARCPEPYQLA